MPSKSGLVQAAAVLSKLGWIARLEAPAKILSGPPAASGGELFGWTSTRHSEAVQRPGTTPKTFWAAESVADGAGAGGSSKPLVNVAGALAVLVGSMLAPEDTWRSKLGGIARMGALAEISAWPPATQAQRRWGKAPRGHPEANQWPEGTSRTWWTTGVIPPTRWLTGKQAG